MEERELVVDEKKDNEADFERLLQLDEEWPDHFEERRRPSAARIEEEGERKHDAMANAVDRPESLNDYLHHQLSWFELEEPIRQLCDKIIYNLDANGYMQGRLEDLVDPSGPSGQLELAQRACRSCKSSIPRRRRPRPQGMPAPATNAGHGLLRRVENAHQ